ncbi:hypothetical protein [Prosthecobacter sp.]|uniref:hypothetical protein n=1 Tax=Prosthecobacter sp. TaxID=1965333 RepID=UPI003783F0E0
MKQATTPTSALACQPRAGSGTAPGVLNVISVYDDFIGAIQACEAVEWLHFHFDGRVRVLHRAWSFASLAGSDMRASAAEDWAGSDLLIISGHGPQPLPEGVHKWINECFGQNTGGPAALVALYDFESTPETLDGPLTRDLRQIAWHWRLEFISNEEFETRMNSDLSRIARLREPAATPGFQFLSFGRSPGCESPPAGSGMLI